jgi:hypothetical protein
MAKYADYEVEQTLDAEIDEASEASAKRESQLPEQFKGKTAEEIAASYEELKKMTDRQANELGDLRKSQNQLTDYLRSSQQPAQAPEPITVDDLYTDPDEAINRAVDKRVSEKLDKLERAQAKLVHDRELEKLESHFPDYHEEARSEEMQEWLKGSGYRQRLAYAADRGDVQAAEDLFSMYYDLKGKEPTQQQKPVVDQQALRSAQLESGTSEVFSPVTKYSRSKLDLARRRAKQGDQEAQQYLTENSDAIFRAYEEGRIVK